MKIATHNETFHADEVTASIIFSLLYDDIEFIRSRDPEVLDSADLVIDVSGKFDLVKYFDHHPTEFTLARDNGIKYATAGLIWNKFGAEVLKKLINTEAIFSDCKDEFTDEIINNALKIIDKKVMEYIDLSDNGQLNQYIKTNICDLQPTEHNDVYEKMSGFYMNTPVIPYIVAMQNVGSNATPEAQYASFIQTIECLTPLFKNIFIRNLIVARDEKKVLNSYKGGEILWLDEELPWIDAAFNNWDIFKDCKVAVVKNNSSYRIKSLPKSPTARFENKCPAPVAWRGKENEELNALVGIKSATFVHKTGFTGGAKTLEDIKVMVEKWIKEAE